MLLLKGDTTRLVLILHIALWLDILNVCLAVSAVALMLRSKSLQMYWPLVALCTWDLAPTLCLALLRRYRFLSVVHAYNFYFGVYWASFAVGAVVSVVITYKVLTEALSPFKGIQSLGIIVYRWVAAMSVIVAFAIIFSPASELIPSSLHAAQQVIRVSAVLNLSLVAFVGFAIRPLGISSGSRLFGASAGLAIASAASLLEAGLKHNNRWMFSGADSLVGTLGECLAQLIWIYYFAKVEPPRRFVLLSVTSPLHAWNQIAAVLGNRPSYAAIGGVPPEAFSTAELGMIAYVDDPNAVADPADNVLGISFPKKYYVNMEGLNAASSVKMPESGPDMIARMRVERGEQQQGAPEEIEQSSSQGA